MTTVPLALHVRRGSPGGGACLVLLHGFPLDHRMWDGVVALLPADVTVVVPDLPGLGASPLDPDLEPSVESSADAVAAAVREAGIESAVVAGLSMGGYVAMALAERHPDLVAGLALVDTRSTPDSAEARSKRLRVADEVLAAHSVAAVSDVSALVGATTRSHRPDVVARLESWAREQSPEGVAWSQRAMAARPDRSAVLSTLAGPSTVVVGEEDELTPPTAAEHMVALLTGAHYVVVPGAGHMSAVEAPAEVAAALVDVVRRVVPTF